MNQPTPQSVTEPEVSAIIPDWSRERTPIGGPGPRLIAALRAHQKWSSRRGPFAALARKFCSLRYRRWSVISGADIPRTTRIAGGLLLPHPNGIVIHPDCIIGPNCLIFQQVTLGLGGKLPGVPTIGGHVDIGAGAKLLGGITIGDHAKIGANAVVLTNVPPHATAVGIPAKIILKTPNHSPQTQMNR